MAAAMAVAPVDHHYHRTPIPHYIHTLFTFLMRAIFFILPFFLEYDTLIGLIVKNHHHHRPCLNNFCVCF